MTRTQIYLPTETHQQLLRLARKKKTTLSHLLRLGAQRVLADETNDSQKNALTFLANPPQTHLLGITGKIAISRIREERDDD